MKMAEVSCSYRLFLEKDLLLPCTVMGPWSTQYTYNVNHSIHKQIQVKPSLQLFEVMKYVDFSKTGFAYRIKAIF